MPQLTGAVGGVCGTLCPLGRAEGSNEPVRAGLVSEALIKYRAGYFFIGPNASRKILRAAG